MTWLFTDALLTTGDENLPTMWEAIKAVLPKQCSKRMKNFRCIGPTTELIGEHFDQLEGGLPIQQDQLLHQCFQRQKEQATEGPLVVSLAELPSRQMLEIQCLQMKKGKAPGIDQVAPEQLQQAMM